MIKEFALEPDVLAGSYHEFRYFIEKFGIEKGRVISCFPKKWKKLVYHAANQKLQGKIELAIIVEKLNNIGNDVIFPSGRSGGDGSEKWIQAAINAHAENPFSAIISNENINDESILFKDNVNEDNQKFKALTQTSINRTSTEMIDTAGFLLVHANHVKMVDTYFDISKPRFRRPFQKILNKLSNRKVTVDIYTSDNMGAQELLRRSKIIETFLPRNITVNLFMLPEEKMHNRFLMSDRGGFIFGTGVDDNEDGNSNPTDEIVIMNNNIYMARWNEYAGKTQLATFQSN